MCIFCYFQGYRCIYFCNHNLKTEMQNQNGGIKSKDKVALGVGSTRRAHNTGVFFNVEGSNRFEVSASPSSFHRPHWFCVFHFICQQFVQAASGRGPSRAEQSTTEVWQRSFQSRAQPRSKSISPPGLSSSSNTYRLRLPDSRLKLQDSDSQPDRQMGSAFPRL